MYYDKQKVIVAGTTKSAIRRIQVSVSFPSV